MANMTEEKKDRITDGLLILSEALTEENLKVSPLDILHYLEGQIIDEEDSGDIRRVFT